MTVGYGRVGTNQFATAKWIVDTNGLSAGATHTTIASAITSASSGETIFIKPGTYTENLTLKAGVNLAAYVCDANSNVIINGTLTATFSGEVSITGISLRNTGSANIITCSGSNAVNLYVQECTFRVTTATGISLTNANALIFFQNCKGYNTTNSNAVFAVTAGTLQFEDLWHDSNNFGNSTVSGGTVNIWNSRLASPVVTSGTGYISFRYVDMPLGTVCVTHGSSVRSFLINCNFEGGSSAALSVSSGSVLVVMNCRIESTQTNAIIGAGELQYAGIDFSDNISVVNTTTQTTGRFFARELAVRTGLLSSIGGSGATNSWTITNPNNTASSASQQIISVAGSTASDAFTTYTITGSQSWSAGADNSDSDAYVLAASTALGTTNVARCSTAGEWNYPLQPCFLVYLLNDVTNVTGDGTGYTIAFDTEIFDQNSDISGSTFTAPVTGRYTFQVAVKLENVGTQTQGFISISTSNREYRVFQVNPSACKTTTDLGLVGCAIADMDAGDTCTTTTTVVGGAKTIGVGGASVLVTYFSGCLLA